MGKVYDGVVDLGLRMSLEEYHDYNLSLHLCHNFEAAFKVWVA